MTITFDEVEPRDVREAVLDAFWRYRLWPWETPEEYEAAWDWRYSSLSDGATTVWVVREGPTVTGHIALHERRFRIGDRELVVGVPGNYWVDPEHRGGLAGPRLAAAVRNAMRRKRVDMVVAFANQAAYEMFSRLGFRQLGTMRSYTDVRRTGPALRRKSALALPAAPALDVALALRRALHGRRRGRSAASGREVVTLSPADVRAMDRSHWTYPEECLVAADSTEYVAGRFLECPFSPRRALGLVDPGANRVEGYVVLEGASQVTVWDCQVNYGRLDPVQAVDRVVDSLGDVEKVQVPLLPDTELADHFRSAGFLKLEADELVTRTRVSALWSDDDPAAARLTDLAGWHLWFGANHF